MPSLTPAPVPCRAGESFLSLLYRFFFFDWLFADITRARNLLEHHAAWRHNVEMRKHLPTYLHRWGWLALTAFGAGSLCDRVWESQWAASCCYTGFGLTMAGMAVIATSWLLLARPASGLGFPPGSRTDFPLDSRPDSLPASRPASRPGSR